MKWVKANERIPNWGKKVFLKWDVGYNVSDHIGTGSFNNFFERKSCHFIGRGTYIEDSFKYILWLDESAPEPAEIKPNDEIVVIGSAKDNDDYHNQLIERVLTDLARCRPTSDQMPDVYEKAQEKLKQVNQLLVNTTASAWVKGIITDYEKMERDIAALVDSSTSWRTPLSVGPFNALKDYVDGQLNFYYKQLQVLHDNVCILTELLNKSRQA